MSSSGPVALYRNKEFLALAGSGFARAQTYSTITIALALYADLFGTSGAMEGLFGTVFALVQLVIVLPLGRYVDEYNAKHFLLGGLVLNVVVFVGYAQVSAVEHVLFVRGLQGISSSVIYITGSAITGELAPDDGRGRWIGTYNQVGAFASLSGDLLGGFLLAAYGFAETYTVLSLVTIAATVATLAWLRDDPTSEKHDDSSTGLGTFRSLLGRSAIRALVAFRLCFSFGKMAVILFLPIYARTVFDMSAFTVGGILAGGRIARALAQGTVGDLIDTLGHKHYFVFTGALMYALGAALIPFAGSAHAWFPEVSLSAMGQSAVLIPAFFWLFLAYAVCGLADSLRRPAGMAMFVEEGKHFNAVAGSLSLRSIAWKIGEVIGPFTVSLVWGATSALVAFGTAAVLIVIASGNLLALYEHEPEPEHVPLEPQPEPEPDD